MTKPTMKNDLYVRKIIKINADKSKVWDALTNPKIIKQYLFGTKTISDWKVGSKIIFKGEYQGKKFQDNGAIEKFEIEKLFQYTYWSELSGMEDKKENYSTATFEIEDNEKGTKLRISQKGFADKAAQEHASQGWSMVLKQIKNILED